MAAIQALAVNEDKLNAVKVERMKTLSSAYIKKYYTVVALKKEINSLRTTIKLKSGEGKSFARENSRIS